MIDKICDCEAEEYATYSDLLLPLAHRPVLVVIHVYFASSLSDLVSCQKLVGLAKGRFSYEKVRANFDALLKRFYMVNANRSCIALPIVRALAQ